MRLVLLSRKNWGRWQGILKNTENEKAHLLKMGFLDGISLMNEEPRSLRLSLERFFQKGLEFSFFFHRA